MSRSLGNYWHVTIATAERLSMLPSEGARRAALRALVRVINRVAPLFAFADDHLHLLLACDRPAAGRIAQRVSLSLAPIVAAALDSAWIGAVKDRGHLRSLVPYILDQSTHHKLETAPHPGSWPGSCFQDLVGARLLGFALTPLREALPRLSRGELFEAVRLPPLDPVSDGQLADAGLAAILAAALDVAAADGAEDRTPIAVRARRTAVRLAHGAGFAQRRIAEVLATTERSVRRAVAAPADVEAERALRMRLALLGATGSR